MEFGPLEANAAAAIGHFVFRSVSFSSSICLDQFSVRIRATASLFFVGRVCRFWKDCCLLDWCKFGGWFGIFAVDGRVLFAVDGSLKDCWGGIRIRGR